MLESVLFEVIIDFNTFRVLVSTLKKQPLEILYTLNRLDKKLIKMFLVIKLIRVPLEVIDNSLIIPFELDLVESGHDQDDLFDRSVTKQFISNRFINRKHPKGSFGSCYLNLKLTRST